MWCPMLIFINIDAVGRRASDYIRENFSREKVADFVIQRLRQVTERLVATQHNATSFPTARHTSHE